MSREEILRAVSALLEQEPPSFDQMDMGPPPEPEAPAPAPSPGAGEPYPPVARVYFPDLRVDYEFVRDVLGGEYAPPVAFEVYYDPDEYPEGPYWTAYEEADKYWVGGSVEEVVTKLEQYLKGLGGVVLDPGAPVIHYFMAGHGGPVVGDET